MSDAPAQRRPPRRSGDRSRLRHDGRSARRALRERWMSAWLYRNADEKFYDTGDNPEHDVHENSDLAGREERQQHECHEDRRSVPFVWRDLARDVSREDAEHDL